MSSGEKNRSCLSKSTQLKMIFPYYILFKNTIAKNNKKSLYMDIYSKIIPNLPI